MLKINPINIINGRSGQFRFVVKCRAGFMTVVDAREFQNDQYNANPAECLNTFKEGALQTVEFKPDNTDVFMTVFARQGKKIKLIDKTILENLKVGTINSFFSKTELYDQTAYAMNGAKTWDDYAYRQNGPMVVEVV